MMKKKGTLAAQIAGLPKLSTIEMRRLWRELYEREPPKLSRLLLIQKLAWRIQELTLGGLDEETHKVINQGISQIGRKGAIPKPRKVKPRVGVSFERLWNGRIYTVITRENGFEYGGEIYKSLTAVARKITGTHTSGPRFFGLKDQKTMVAWNDTEKERA